MLPSFPNSYRIYRGPTNVKLSSNDRPAHTPKQSFDALHMCLRKFGFVVFFSTGILVLFNRVSRVLFSGAKEKMIWIYAQFVIPTGTIMADKFPFGNWTVGNNPRHSVGFYFHTTRPSGVPITPRNGTGPEPAGLGFIDTPPKGFWEIVILRVTLQRTKRSLSLFVKCKRLGTIIANIGAFGGRFCRHSGLSFSSFCLGGSEGFASLRTAENLAGQPV